ncbi:MAG TPA: hypothetical protein VMG12_27725, partial [Polyangiaceae bacterium]|nr:hypothetical protein [Polyangiaceae bacterium]
MRFARPLLVAWCIGSIAGGCTSDLQLALEGKACKNEHCVDGYTCDIPNNRCILLGTPLPSAGAGGTRPINPTGGTGSGTAGSGGDGGAGGDDSMPAGQGGAGVGGAAGGVPEDGDGGVEPPDPSDAGDACIMTRIYRDRDGDGFGNVSDARIGCPGNGWVVDDRDCRDDNPLVKPGQTDFFAE